MRISEEIHNHVEALTNKQSNPAPTSSEPTPPTPDKKGMGKVTTTDGAFVFDKINGMSMSMASSPSGNLEHALTSLSRKSPKSPLKKVTR